MGMVLGVSAGIANILLDYIFMVPLQMGIKGAAFGTGIGYMIPAVIGLLFFSTKKNHLHFRKPVIDFSVLAESCTNGFSEMVSRTCSTDSRTNHNDCSIGFSSSEQGNVSLRIKNRISFPTEPSDNFCS